MTEQKKKYATAEIVKALKEARGMIYAASRMLGCVPNTIYKRAKREPEIKAAIEEEREVQIDRAELQLMKAIDAGEAWAICFYLKCQAKKRGYIERQPFDLPAESTKKMYGQNMPIDEV